MIFRKLKNRIKDLEGRVCLLEYPYEFKIGQKVYWNPYKNENYKCLIINRSLEYNGSWFYKRYKIFIEDSTTEVCESELTSKQIK
jgi:hypothetical protein